METTDVRVALMTAPNVEVATRIVRTLVDNGVIACGNIVPGVTSLYRWAGEVQQDTEVLVVMKTTANLAPVLLEQAPALHPYDVPEVLLLPVTAGHQPYLDWVASSVAVRGSEGTET